MEPEADREDPASQELQVRGDTAAWGGAAAALLGVPARRRLQRVLPHAAERRCKAGVYRSDRLCCLSPQLAPYGYALSSAGHYDYVFVAPEAGVLTLTWDNSYSYFNKWRW